MADFGNAREKLGLGLEPMKKVVAVVGSILFEELISAIREFVVELGLQAMIFQIDRHGDRIAVAICRSASRGIS